MPYLFIILAKVNLVLALFAITYYLVLRRLTFYVLNRSFLVFGILFSSLYPFIDLTNFFHNQQQLSPRLTTLVPAINEQVKDLAPTGFIAQYHQLISILFYTGVAIMALRLILQLFSLYKLHKNSSAGFVNDIPVRILANPVNPFTFWQTIYINPSLHEEKDLQSILAHEYVHVKQWHTLDIILAELSVVFYWFNPGAWLMNKAVKENLEFITDEKVLKSGADKKSYQYSLLNTGTLPASVGFTNSFNISDLKKRIQMMNARRSSRLMLSRYVLALPVLLVITLSFTVSKKKVITWFAPAIPQVVYAKETGASGNEQIAATKKLFNKPASSHTNAVNQTDNNDGTDSRELVAVPVLPAQDTVPKEEIKSISDNSRYNTFKNAAVVTILPQNANWDDRHEVVVVGHPAGPGYIKPNAVAVESKWLQRVRRHSVQTDSALSFPKTTGTVRIVRGYPFNPPKKQ